MPRTYCEICDSLHSISHILWPSTFTSHPAYCLTISATLQSCGIGALTLHVLQGWLVCAEQQAQAMGLTSFLVPLSTLQQLDFVALPPFLPHMLGTLQHIRRPYLHLQIHVGFFSETLCSRHFVVLLCRPLFVAHLPKCFIGFWHLPVIVDPKICF